MNRLTNKGLGYLILVIVTIIGAYFFAHNASDYQAPVFKIKHITEEKITPSQTKQHLNGQLLNQDKVALEVTNSYYFSEADSFKLKTGDVVFLNDSRDRITEIKRDQQVFYLIVGFIFLLYTVASNRFLKNLLIILLNIAMFIVLARWYLLHTHFSLPLMMMGYSLCSIGLTTCFISQQRRQRLAIFLSAVGGTFLAWGLSLLILRLTNHTGLRYEDIGIVTRPYRTIYYSSLLIGTLGATTDIAVTILTTISELLEKQPTTSFKRLYQASRNVGQNILGPMTNVLFFVCLSEMIPMSVLYLENGWSYQVTFSHLFSLELFRALSGGLGIVLTIPFSVMMGSYLLRGDV